MGGTDQARERAAKALRALGHALVERDADDELLLGIADRADRIVSDLESVPMRERDLVAMKMSMFPDGIPDGGPIHHFDECFVSGRHNPLGIGARPRRVGDEVVAEVTLGAAFEGAPGRSHGGIVAAVFDDVLGYLLTVHSIPAFTGELSVRYLAPTPMGVPLEFRSRIIEREGRRIHCEAEATSDGDRIATSEATFIEVEPSRFRS